MLSARNKHSAIKIDVQMIYDFSVFFYVNEKQTASLQNFALFAFISFH